MHECLTIFEPMEISIKLYTIRLEWSSLYIEGSWVIIKNAFLSLKVDLSLANSADPDEMPLYAAFHLGRHCLPTYPFRSFRSSKC